MDNKLPSGWVRAKLGYLGAFKSAGADKKENSNEFPIGLVNYMDVYRNTKLDNSYRWMRVTAKRAEIQKCNLLKGDILLTPTSETPDDIGHSAVVMEDLKEAIFSYHLVRFRLHDQEIFDLEFRRYFLNHYPIAKYFYSRATGITRYTLSRNDFRNCSISFPKDVNEQHNIAEILSKVDGIINSTKNSITKAERLKKALMQNLLSGKLKPDGTWRNEDEFYKDEKFGNVPKGWIYNKLGALVNKITDGEHISPDMQDKGEYLISAEDVFNDGIHFENPKFVSKKDCIKFRKRCDPELGDVLIVSRGASVGRTCKVQTTKLLCMMGSVILIKPQQAILINDFISLYLKTYAAWKELRRLSGSSAQQAIYLAHLKKMRILFPEDLIEQQRIINTFEGVDKSIFQKQDKLRKLERLKKALMQNLLRGRVRVKVPRDQLPPEIS